MTFGSTRTILGSQNSRIFFSRKNDNFSFGYFMTPMTPFRHEPMNGKRMPSSKSAHQITHGGTKTRKMTYDVIKGH